jgi:N-formylglutamate amidohydrolase
LQDWAENNITQSASSSVSPIIVSVPHAGRHYPSQLQAQSRLTPEQLSLLEDRHVDALTEPLIGMGHQILVATTARAWIDLNRAPQEIEPGMIARTDPGFADMRAAALKCDQTKISAGLGLLPSRVPRIGTIYRHPLTLDDIQHRTLSTHTPWHEAIDHTMAAAWQTHGFAVLIDLHSMPTIPRGQQGHGLRAVIGDRHGQSCDIALAARAVAVLRQENLRTDLNRPYAGAYTLMRHGQPRMNLHALQVEFDRSLYLDDLGNPIAARVELLSGILARLCRELAEIGRMISRPEAAE